MNAYARLLTKATSSQTLGSIAKRLLPEWVTIFMLHRLEVPEAGVSGLKGLRAFGKSPESTYAIKATALFLWKTPCSEP